MDENEKKREHSPFSGRGMLLCCGFLLAIDYSFSSFIPCRDDDKDNGNLNYSQQFQTNALLQYHIATNCLLRCRSLYSAHDDDGGKKESSI
jgi:hypothetical protein